MRLIEWREHDGAVDRVSAERLRKRVSNPTEKVFVRLVAYERFETVNPTLSAIEITGDDELIELFVKTFE